VAVNEAQGAAPSDLSCFRGEAIVEACGGAVPGEDLLGDLKDALAVSLGVGAGLAGGQRCRELLFRHMQVYRKDSATGDSLRLSLHAETVSALLVGDADVNSGAIFIGRVITAGGQPCVYL
jgi:hypothetical protein